MGEKLIIGIVLILPIILALTSVSFLVINLRGEEIEVSANGVFGQIEVSDTESRGRGYFNFELDAERPNQIIRTGWAPLNRIIEIRVLKNEGVFEQYVDYIPLENNTYNIANVTIIMNSRYEPVGYINQVEKDYSLLVGAGLWLMYALILLFGLDIIDTRYSRWKRRKNDRKREAEKKKKLEEKKDKKK